MSPTPNCHLVGTTISPGVASQKRVRLEGDNFVVELPHEREPSVKKYPLEAEIHAYLSPGGRGLW